MVWPFKYVLIAAEAQFNQLEDLKREIAQRESA